MKYKKYILFAGLSKYPKCGLNAIIESFDTETEARQYFHSERRTNDWDWYQIADRDTWRIIIGMDPSDMG